MEVAKPPRRQLETTALTHPIRVALNKMPGVRLWRNNVGMLTDSRGVPVRYGLAVGSADLVGLVVIRYRDPLTLVGWGTGRFFALEVKRPGKRPTTEQLAWLACVRELGGFACSVRSVDEAIAAVGRCRDGASE